MNDVKKREALEERKGNEVYQEKIIDPNERVSSIPVTKNHDREEKSKS